MQGKVIRFKGNVDKFNANGKKVTITLIVNPKDISLDALNSVQNGPVMVNLEASQTELLPENEESNAKD